MRLVLIHVKLKKERSLLKFTKKNNIERHRHRYEVNNKFKEE